MYKVKYNKELSNSFNEETRKNNREEHIINNTSRARHSPDERENDTPFTIEIGLFNIIQSDSK